VPYFYGTWAYLKAKGRSGAWVLLAGTLIGMIVILLLKDHAKNGQPPCTPCAPRVFRLATCRPPEDHTIKAKRDRAILATLLYHALRRDELPQFAFVTNSQSARYQSLTSARLWLFFH
jgi:hypothetical protein